MRNGLDGIMDGIIKEMESGVVPWEKPWFSVGKKNLVSGKEYRGINRVLLANKQDQYYVTFNQAHKLGGHVNKGAKGLTVVFWQINEYEHQNAGGELETKTVPLMKTYTVFGVSDCTGLTVPVPVTATISPLAAAEQYVEGLKRYGADIQSHDQDKAFYSPGLDYINMPDMKWFKDQAGYYGTMLHELAHWTGHESRLKRHNERAHFGGEVYSKEELIAELSAATLSARFGLDTVKQSAAYCLSWLKALKNDRTLLISAASKADKAIQYLDEANEKMTAFAAMSKELMLTGFQVGGVK